MFSRTSTIVNICVIVGAAAIAINIRIAVAIVNCVVDGGALAAGGAAAVAAGVWLGLDQYPLGWWYCRINYINAPHRVALVPVISGR